MKGLGEIGRTTGCLHVDRGCWGYEDRKGGVRLANEGGGGDSSNNHAQKRGLASKTTTSSCKTGKRRKSIEQERRRPPLQILKGI